MTIDETIDREKRMQRINELEDKVTGIKSTNPQYHKQIVEWLEELKSRRNIDEFAYRQGYNNAIYEVEQFIEFFITKRMSYEEAKAILKELKG